MACELQKIYGGTAVNVLDEVPEGGNVGGIGSLWARTTASYAISPIERERIVASAALAAGFIVKKQSPVMTVLQVGPGGLFPEKPSLFHRNPQ